MGGWVGVGRQPRWGWLGQLGPGGALRALTQLQLHKAKLSRGVCIDG